MIVSNQVMGIEFKEFSDKPTKSQLLSSSIPWAVNVF